MYSLCNALKYLKSKQIMVRNLKPLNLIFKSIKDVSSITIVDFSLAVYEYIRPIDYPNCGTPGYIAPEVINYDADDKIYNCQCDVFSLGLIFHILLTGKSIFLGEQQE